MLAGVHQFVGLARLFQGEGAEHLRPDSAGAHVRPAAAVVVLRRLQGLILEREQDAAWVRSEVGGVVSVEQGGRA